MTIKEIIKLINDKYDTDQFSQSQIEAIEQFKQKLLIDIQELVKLKDKEWL